jgi:hypothetical protein
LHFWYMADKMQLHSGELHVAKTMLARWKSALTKKTIRGGAKPLGKVVANDMYQLAARRKWAKDTWKAHSHVRHRAAARAPFFFCS